ncbi:hypothetical protein RFI_18857, partial [Reticulomyxa filosa]
MSSQIKKKIVDEQWIPKPSRHLFLLQTQLKWEKGRGSNLPPLINAIQSILQTYYNNEKFSFEKFVEFLKQCNLKNLVDTQMESIREFYNANVKESTETLVNYLNKELESKGSMKMGESKSESDRKRISNEDIALFLSEVLCKYQIKRQELKRPPSKDNNKSKSFGQVISEHCAKNFAKQTHLSFEQFYNDVIGYFHSSETSMQAVRCIFEYLLYKQCLDNRDANPKMLSIQFLAKSLDAGQVTSIDKFLALLAPFAKDYACKSMLKKIENALRIACGNKERNVVTLDEFVKAIQTLCSPSNSKEMIDLVNGAKSMFWSHKANHTSDHNSGDLLCIEEFMNELQQAVSTAPPFSSSSSSSSSSSQQQLDSVVFGNQAWEWIQLLLLSNSSFNKKVCLTLNMQELSLNEFCKKFHEIGIANFSREEACEIYATFQESPDLHFEEFLQYLMRLHEEESLTSVSNGHAEERNYIDTWLHWKEEVTKNCATTKTQKKQVPTQTQMQTQIQSQIQIQMQIQKQGQRKQKKNQDNANVGIEEYGQMNNVGVSGRHKLVLLSNNSNESAQSKSNSSYTQRSSRRRAKLTARQSHFTGKSSSRSGAVSSLVLSDEM